MYEHDKKRHELEMKLEFGQQNLDRLQDSHEYYAYQGGLVMDKVQKLMYEARQAEGIADYAKVLELALEAQNQLGFGRYVLNQTAKGRKELKYQEWQIGLLMDKAQKANAKDAKDYREFFPDHAENLSDAEAAKIWRELKQTLENMDSTTPYVFIEPSYLGKHHKNSATYKQVETLQNLLVENGESWPWCSTEEGRRTITNQEAYDAIEALKNGGTVEFAAGY